jgi:hypothetical protein
MATLPWAGIVFVIVAWAFPFGVKVTVRYSEEGEEEEFGELHDGNFFLCFLPGEYEIIDLVMVLEDC